MENTTDVVYAFVDTVEKAHHVASHIYLKGPSGVSVGFNESKRGEGYVVVDASIDIAQIVRDVAVQRYRNQIEESGENFENKNSLGLPFTSRW